MSDSIVIGILKQSYPNAFDKSHALNRIAQQRHQCCEQYRHIIEKAFKNQSNGHISERVKAFDAIKKRIIVETGMRM